MELSYQINPDLPVPMYRQLVDAISAAIHKGELSDGQQLPTVQELSSMLDVARGTAKRIYDELERLGLVEKVQGRGTFVSYRIQETGSRKERAMVAIDRLLDELEGMGLSAGEINIFLDLKLRQRAEQMANVKVVLLECNPENLSHISEQLRAIENIDLFSYLLDSVEKYPYQIGEDVDIILTTQHHADAVERILPVKKRVVRAALRLTPTCLSRIIRFRSGQQVGILCYSPRFGTLLKETCAEYAEDVQVDEPVQFSGNMDIQGFLEGKHAVLLPESYEKYCTEPVLKALHDFKGQLIPCAYELDEGSFLYLREKAKRILESKML